MQDPIPSLIVPSILEFSSMYEAEDAVRKLEGVDINGVQVKLEIVGVRVSLHQTKFSLMTCRRVVVVVVVVATATTVVLPRRGTTATTVLVTTTAAATVATVLLLVATMGATTTGATTAVTVTEARRGEATMTAPTAGVETTTGTAGTTVTRVTTGRLGMSATAMGPSGTRGTELRGSSIDAGFLAATIKRVRSDANRVSIALYARLLVTNSPLSSLPSKMAH
jgi:hypothetical protein